MLNKKILTGVIALALSAAAINATAATSGVYIGARTGYGAIHPLLSNFSMSSNHLAGGLFAGYQFNPNIAMEMGFSHFGDSKINFNNASYAMVRTNVFDLSVKGIVPIADKVSLFGKLGVASVVQQVEGKYLSTYKLSFSDWGFSVLPEFGAGMSYELTDNVSADLFYTHIQKVRGCSSSIDFAGVGLTYNFG